MVSAGELLEGALLAPVPSVSTSNSSTATSTTGSPEVDHRETWINTPQSWRQTPRWSRDIAHKWNRKLCPETCQLSVGMLLAFACLCYAVYSVVVFENSRGNVTRGHPHPHWCEIQDRSPYLLHGETPDGSKIVWDISEHTLNTTLLTPFFETKGFDVIIKFKVENIFVDRVEHIITDVGLSAVLGSSVIFSFKTKHTGPREVKGYCDVNEPDFYTNVSLTEPRNTSKPDSARSLLPNTAAATFDLSAKFNLTSGHFSVNSSAEGLLGCSLEKTFKIQSLNVLRIEVTKRIQLRDVEDSNPLKRRPNLSVSCLVYELRGKEGKVKLCPAPTDQKPRPCQSE